MSPREELAVPLVVSPVVIDLHVPGASLEWAIPAPDVDWVLDALKTDRTGESAV
jgi:L-aminopeptidase/D-esterase-like protein